MKANIITRWLAKRLRKSLVHGVASRRPPDFLIGDKPEEPYMRRWWIIPRNRWLNAYLHHFLKDDDDRALHDHPWLSLSLALDGDMIEIYRRGKNDVFRTVATGDVILRGGRFTHRMIVPQPSWTLFITGPRYREWGFACPAGWRPWQEFVARDNPGKPGRGCD